MSTGVVPYLSTEILDLKAFLHFFHIQYVQLIRWHSNCKFTVIKARLKFCLNVQQALFQAAQAREVGVSARAVWRGRGGKFATQTRSMKTTALTVRMCFSRCPVYQVLHPPKLFATLSSCMTITMP